MPRTLVSLLPSSSFRRRVAPRRTDRTGAACVAQLLERRVLLSAWATVDAFALLPGSSSISGAFAMTADAAGNVYAAGLSGDANAVAHGVVREKPSGSADWQTIEDFSGGLFKSLAVDSKGNLYAGGWRNDGSNPEQWIVLERPAGQNSFAVIDDFQAAAGERSYNFGLAADAQGNIFAVGAAEEGTLGFQGVVRKRAVGQATFTTVDNFTGDSVTTIASGPSAGVYVVGQEAGQWAVRKSADGGKTWSTEFRSDPSQIDINASATAVYGDAAGDLYVVGQALETTSRHWIVTESADGGGSWTVVDDYQLSPSESAGAHSVGADLAGNLYVVGNAADADGTFHGIIRTNAGGSWTTVDDHGPNSNGYAFTTASTGDLFAAVSGAEGGWVVRSAPGPIATRVTLDFNYLVTLARNYSHPGTFATGDLNGDGQVGFDDLVLLARNYGKVVSPADFSAIANVAAQPASSPSFSSTVIAPSNPTRAHHRRPHVRIADHVSGSGFMKSRKLLGLGL